jgi:HD-GYP domain-containing protein (c-di-GMP phosphodiesterase class II)
MALLLIQSDSDLREKLAFAVESTFGEEVLQANGAFEALYHAQSASTPISLIIFDYDPDAIAAADNFDELFACTPRAELIVFEDRGQRFVTPVGWRLLESLERRDMISHLVQCLTRFSDSGRISLHARQNDEYFCKIKTKLLLSVCPLEGDIYIRLSDKKYVKLFKKGDEFNLEDMEKYTIQKGVEFLYLSKESLAEFIQKYSVDVQDLMATAQKLKPEDVISTYAFAYETVQECSRRVGFTKDVQALTKFHVQLCLKQMGKSPKLARILEKVKTQTDQYIGAHSLVTGYMACAIAAHMEWGSDVTFFKLTLAAFLHDVVLDDNRLAHCDSLDEARVLSYEDATIAQYKLHPIKAAEISRQFHEVPADVDTIILQHHERPDASGFPRGVGHTYIAPLSTVFIVAHDMAQYFFDHDKNFFLQDFITLRRENYKNLQFRKVMDAVEKLELN